MKTFVQQAQRYTAYHESPITWHTHTVGIPLILFSVLILLGFVHIIVPNVFDVTLADLFVLGLLIYYFWLNWIIALILTPALIFMLWLAVIISGHGPDTFAIWTFIIVFLLGCIAQMAGHLVEGNKPAFLHNPEDAIASPMFITAEWLFRAGWFQGLKEKIHGVEVKPTERANPNKRK